MTVEMYRVQNEVLEIFEGFVIRKRRLSGTSRISKLLDD